MTSTPMPPHNERVSSHSQTGTQHTGLNMQKTTVSALVRILEATRAPSSKMWPPHAMEGHSSAGYAPQDQSGCGYSEEEQKI